MPAIHHATAKRADRVNITLTIENGEVIAREADSNLLLAQGLNAKDVLQRAEQQRLADNEPDSDEPEDDESDMDPEAEDSDGPQAESALDDSEAADADDEDEAEPSERSIVKRKYRKRYHPMNRTCGDDLAKELDAHLKEDGALNVERLVRFAKANDCWVDSYLSLNPGQIRMNVGNRLRAKIKKGWEVRWTA